MSRIPMKFLLFSLLTITMTTLIVGCTNSNSTVKTETPIEPTTAKIKHFFADASSNILLSFDYPNTWITDGESIIEGTNISQLSFYDPRFLTVPTIPQDNVAGIVDEYGFVTILVIPIEDNMMYANLIQEFVTARSDNKNVRIDKSYQIVIDGHYADVYISQIEPSEDNGYLSPRFEEVIFLSTSARIYEIFLDISINEKSGDFEKEFQLLLTSLKIVDSE